jgi:pimeloyl-ACP methyl ester carboxylesterase
MKVKNNLPCLVLSVLMVLMQVSCSDSKPLPATTTVSPTPTIQAATENLPGDQKGFFLVADGKTFPLQAQHLTERESVYGYGLPQTSDSYPIAMFHTDSIDPNALLLRRMIGGIGFSPEPDPTLGGVHVRGVRLGFGAEAGGLRTGDLIIAIDDKPLGEMFALKDFEDRLGTMITGELGSQVKLTIKRDEQQLDLTTTRDLPTFLSISDTTTGSVRYRLEEKDNVTQLVPESTLSAGLYCYQSGVSASSFGDLYCFLQGNMDIAWPVPPALTADASSTRLNIFASSNFEKTDCRFLTLGQDVECGDLNVPEDYSQPDGRKIRIHVAVFRSSSDPQPDPVIYLHGGPGVGALKWMPTAYQSGLQSLFPNRDFIVFDQRGTGYSEPRLDCPSLADGYVSSLSTDQRVSSLGWETMHIDTCLKDLEKRGINLSAYTTMASAADLDALIKTLGYKQVNLWGQSYGTYLALTYMREYGNDGSVRSVVLDGVSPPQKDFMVERGKNAQAAWDAIFLACEADSACRKAYPDIKTSLYKLLDRLATQSIALQKTTPYNGQSQQIIVNDFVFLEALYRSSYESNWISKVPALIVQTNQGDTTLLDSALSNVFESEGSADHGIYYAVTCGNAVNFTSEGKIQAENSQLAEPLRAYFNNIALGTFNLCEHWTVMPASPTKNQPVASDIPTLLLSGAFDPTTSPTWAKLASETLSNGYLIEFPAEAHDLMATNSCAPILTYKFIENPVKPQDYCLGYLSGPVFIMP